MLEEYELAEDILADSGYKGAQSRVQSDDLQWHTAAPPSDIAKLPDGRAKNGRRSGT